MNNTNLSIAHIEQVLADVCFKWSVSLGLQLHYPNCDHMTRVAKKRQRWEGCGGEMGWSLVGRVEWGSCCITCNFFSCTLQSGASISHLGEPNSPNYKSLGSTLQRSSSRSRSSSSLTMRRKGLFPKMA